MPTSYIETLDTFSFSSIGSFADTSAVVNDLSPDYLAETAQRGFIGHLMFRAIRGLDSFGRNRTAAGDKYPSLTLAMHFAPGLNGGYFGAQDFENGRPISGTLNFAFAAFEAAPLGKAASSLRFAMPRVPSLSFGTARNLFDEPIRFFDIQLTPNMGFGVMSQGTRVASNTTFEVLEQGRDSFGRFLPTSGVAGIPGADAVDEFVELARASGYEILGTELSFRTPFGLRRFDAVLLSPTGEIGGVEIKSSLNAFNRFDAPARQQFSADRYINLFGAAGVGKAEDLFLDSTIKILFIP